MAKTKSNSKRKTRSDKFPLTLHPTGQYCKKIKSKLYYFGKDKKIALQRYLQQATDLHNGRSLQNNSFYRNGITIRTLCNLYLDHQNSNVLSSQITAGHYKDQVNSLRIFARFLGQHRLLSEISTLDLQNYKKKLLKSYGSTHRVNLNLAIMKAMFHWAKKNEVLENIPNIDAISKVKIVQKERTIFTANQIKQLLKIADDQMKAMILLGLNCGFGCTDCSELKWRDLELENGRVKLARKKTGISRNLPLWSETVQSLKRLPKCGNLVFYTSKGNPCVRTISSVGKDGIVKYSNDNFITKKFSKLKAKANIKTEKGVGFYTLRRTAATLAARSGDPFAVQQLRGHADLKMATTYVQDVSEQTDRVINNSRKLIIQDDS
ncbi:MAG: tyrosine-type recombinase/integrase [Deltaproteobacteria bacterium]|nr:tyrosine-type recombinase/integrase [Deltaproteobacteria bacterium]